MAKKMRYCDETPPHAGSPAAVWPAAEDTPGFSRDDIARLLGGYMASGLMRSDFESMEPHRRIAVLERLLPYIVPRLRNVDPDESAGDAAEPAIDEILRALVREDTEDA